MIRYRFANNFFLTAIITNPTEDEADALHQAGFLFVKSDTWNGLTKELYIYIPPDFNWGIGYDVKRPNYDDKQRIV